VRTSRSDAERTIGREPNPEELAEKSLHAAGEGPQGFNDRGKSRFDSKTPIGDEED